MIRIISSREIKYDDTKSRVPTVTNAARVAFFTHVGTFCYPLASGKIGTEKSV